jgi:hypothetical protein
MSVSETATCLIMNGIRDTGSLSAAIAVNLGMDKSEVNRKLSALVTNKELAKVTFGPKAFYLLQSEYDDIPIPLSPELTKPFPPKLMKPSPPKGDEQLVVVRLECEDVFQHNMVKHYTRVKQNLFVCVCWQSKFTEAFKSGTCISVTLSDGRAAVACLV